MDIEYPIYPSIAIFLLPYLSDALPHGADVIAQATADKEKISKTLTLIDSLAFLWPELVPIKKVDGDAQALSLIHI